jgi:hypothetical protein
MSIVCVMWPGPAASDRPVMIMYGRPDLPGA